MLLLIPNISLFLSGLNFPANSSESVTFDHIYEKLIDISTIDVLIVQISTAKRNSRRRRRDSSAVFIGRDEEKGRKFTRFAKKKIAELRPKKTTRTAKATLDE